MYTALYILLFHWIADFVMQTHEMATQKSKSNIALGKHILSYGLGMIPVSVLAWLITDNVSRAIGWLIMNMLFHFVTDYFTSRKTGQLYLQQRYHDFFVVIGLDQLIHFTTLFLTFQYLILE